MSSIEGRGLANDFAGPQRSKRMSAVAGDELGFPGQRDSGRGGTPAWAS